MKLAVPEDRRELPLLVKLIFTSERQPLHE